MKKVIVLVLASVALFSCQQEKTAFVDNEKLIEEYQERKDIEDKYKVKVEALTKKKDSISKALQAEVVVLKAKGANLSPAKQQELYNPYMQKSQFLQQQIQQEEQIMSQQSQAEIDYLLKKINEAISTYGETNGYTYIFGKNKVGSVVYGAEKNDITKIILDDLNKSYATAE
jgi:outer membrane protein